MAPNDFLFRINHCYLIMDYFVTRTNLQDLFNRPFYSINAFLVNSFRSPSTKCNILQSLFITAIDSKLRNLVPKTLLQRVDTIILACPCSSSPAVPRVVQCPDIRKPRSQLSHIIPSLKSDYPNHRFSSALASPMEIECLAILLAVPLDHGQRQPSNQPKALKCQVQMPRRESLMRLSKILQRRK